MQIKVKNRGFITQLINFEKYENIDEFANLEKVDFIEILGNSVLLYGKYFSSLKQQSLLTDLTMKDIDIWKSFRSNYRNEINKAESEGVTVYQYDSIELQENECLLEIFVNTYEKMFKSKGIVRKIPENMLLSYIKNNFFVLTTAKNEDGEMIVFHSYVTDWKNQTKLWQSCSLFRESEDNKYRNYIGRVNKFLHWKDIEYWKSVNINTLDWGGVDFKEEKGISSFKQGFGGELVTYYNINIANSFRAKLYRKMRC